MYPTLIDLGTVFGIHLGIHSYGVMLATAFITCSILLRHELNRRGYDGDIATTLVVTGAIGGIVGAKIYYIFLDGRIEVAEIFSPSGLVWYGGLIGGSAAVSWFIYRSPNPFLQTIDVLGPLVLLGYGIGRIGCLLAGDGDYGPPSDLPWAMAFPNGTVPTDVPVHPTPIYETLLSVSFFVLIWSQRKKYVSTPGFTFGVSLVLIGVERFIVEFWRLTPRVFPETSSLHWLTSAQVVSILLICFGIYFSVWMFQRPRVEAEPETPMPEPDKEKPRPNRRKRRR